jgi:hypothetical protein
VDVGCLLQGRNTTIVTVWPHDVTDEEFKANVRLVESSPNLLEQCQILRELIIAMTTRTREVTQHEIGVRLRELDHYLEYLGALDGPH